VEGGRCKGCESGRAAQRRCIQFTAQPC
jgi:hypothetical protein